MSIERGIKMIDWQVIQGNSKHLPLADESIDLTVTSPPYDNLRMYNGFDFDFEAIAKELYRVTKKGGVVVWVVGDATVNGSETGSSFRQALFFKEIGFNLHDTMIYEKNGFSKPDSTRYHNVFEYMFVFSKDKPRTFNPLIDKKNTFPVKWSSKITMRERDGRQTPHNHPTTFGEYGKRYNIWKLYTGAGYTTLDDYAFQHPAVFPEALARDHILSWSNEGDTVLDCFCGSGTTGKMAVILKRKFIGIEISKEYCDLSKVRITRACGIPCDKPKRIRDDVHLPLFSE